MLACLGSKAILGAGGVRKNAASGQGAGLNGEAVNEDAGLVEGHAYSILDAKELGLIPGLKLGGGLLGQARTAMGMRIWPSAWA